MSNVTLKDTKDKIWAALQETQQKLNDLQSAKLDPAADMAKKTQAATIENTQAVRKASVTEMFASMGSEIVAALTEAASSVEKSLQDYKTVEDGIAIKRSELQELYDIDAALLDLTAIINLQSELKEQHKQEDQDRLFALREKITTLEMEHKHKFDLYREEELAYKKNLKEVREREEADYKYDFDRAKKKEQDLWEDEKALAKKQMDLEKEQLDQREAAIEEREQHMDNLQFQISTIPEQIQGAVDKAVEEKTKSLNAGFAIEKNYLKKEIESAQSLSDTKLQNANDRLAEANETVDELRKQLAEAYGKLNELAGKTVEAAGNSRMIASLESVIKDGKGNTK